MFAAFARLPSQRRTRRARQYGLDVAGDEVNADLVEPAFGDDHVGVAFRRLDELQVHRPHGRLVLRDDGFDGAAALVDVAVEAADEAYVGVAVYENLHVHQAAHLRIEEDEDAFDDDDRARLDVNGL